MPINVVDFTVLLTKPILIQYLQRYLPIFKTYGSGLRDTAIFDC